MTESHERILVVDDEKHVRILFSRILQKEGYEVNGPLLGVKPSRSWPTVPLIWSSPT
jgi:hypothetical protein